MDDRDDDTLSYLMLSAVYFLPSSVHSLTAPVRIEVYQPFCQTRPQVADGGKASRYGGEGNCKYIE